MWELDDAIEELDALLAEQQQRDAVVARMAAHADAQGWSSWWESLTRRIRRDRSAPRLPEGVHESFMSIRARKLKEREEAAGR